MKISIRKAEKSDILAIHSLLHVYAQKQIVLERSCEDIEYYLANFTVAEIIDIKTEKHELIGCVALRAFGNELKEVRSLVVKEEFHNQGVGKKMLNFLIANLKDSGEKLRIFALTYRDDFFKKLGFHQVEKELFPEKIWADCEDCPKKNHCDEIAVLLEIN